MKFKKVDAIKDLLLPTACSISSNCFANISAAVTKIDKPDVSTSSKECTKKKINSTKTEGGETRSEENKHSMITVNNLDEAGDADSKCLLDPDDICTLKKNFLQEKQRCEKYEELINELKNIAVQLQERVTTALDVDKSKNKEIETCYVGLIEATNEIIKINGEKDELEQYFQQQLKKYDEELTRALKNVNNYEQEATKSFKLACDYQKELCEVERLNTKLIERLGKIEPILIDLENKYIAKIESNKQLHELLLQKDEEIKQMNGVLLNSKLEVEQSTSVVSTFQNQYDTLKTEYAQLQTYLSEYEGQVKVLQSQNNNLLSENENLKSIQSKMHQDIIRAKLSFEKNQLELKTYCHSKMNIPVMNNHQGTLSDEGTPATETSSDVCINKKAISHVRELNQRYVRIINLLQEKHREEINLYQVKLELEQEESQNLRSKFRELYGKRDSIVRQLYNMTEIEWMEMLDLTGTTGQMYVSRGLEWHNKTENFGYGYD